MWWWTTVSALAGNTCDDGGKEDAGLISLDGDDYDTIQDAVDDADDGDTVLVCSGYYEEAVVVSRAITLRAVDGPAATTISGRGLPGDAALTLDVPGKDVVVDGFAITDGDAWGAGVLVTGDTDVTVVGTWVFANEAVGIDAGPNADLEIVDTDVFANRSTGIAADGAGLLSLSNTRVYDNVGAARGGGLWLGAGRTLIGGEVFDNQADRGAGVYVTGEATIAFAVILDNVAKQDGGGIWFGGRGSRLAVEASRVSGNHAIGNGGGIHVDPVAVDSALILESTEVEDNLAHDGGGLWVSGAVVGSRATVAGNEATRFGGGAWLSPDARRVENVAFTSNHAVEGGGLYVLTEGLVDLSLDDLAITHNVARWSGGGLSLRMRGSYAGTVVAERPVITDNQVVGSTIVGEPEGLGGGIRAVSEDDVYHDLEITDGRVERNRADRGGGLWIDAAGLFLARTAVRENTAVVDGAGAWLDPTLSGPDSYLLSADGDWANLPKDVVLGAGPSYGWGSVDFVCGETHCDPL